MIRLTAFPIVNSRGTSASITASVVLRNPVGMTKDLSRTPPAGGFFRAVRDAVGVHPFVGTGIARPPNSGTDDRWSSLQDIARTHYAMQIKTLLSS